MNGANRPSQALLNAQKELNRRRRLADVSYRPPVSPATDPILPERLLQQEATPACAPSPSATLAPNTTLRVSPTIAANCLDKVHRHRGAALDGPYRLYKILGALDGPGRGWLANRAVEHTLTSKDGPCYIYGRRRLKTMLKRGEGLFWNRVKSEGEVRIRLVARVKVAHLLGCGRLRGREVQLPLKSLLGHGRGRQADVNAILYASIHAGQINHKKEAQPITRNSIRHISGCSPYRQRDYERRAGVRVETNIRILGPYSDYNLARARQYTNLPAYKHLDYRGKINRHQRGAAYLAVRLPNTYIIPDTFKVSHSRRQRTLNRLLDGLCHTGSGGSAREDFVHLYHRDAVTAVRSFTRDPKTTAYWPLVCAKGKGTSLWRTVGDLD